MTTDIFIKSYAKDFPWLKNCLRSVTARCHGFRRVIIVVPTKDLATLAGFGLTREILIGITEPEGKGYDIQQCIKLEADTYTDADFITFLDSDLYLLRECSPDSFVADGKPTIYMTEFSKLDTPWKPILDYVMKQNIPYEFMRRHPFTYPRWIFKTFREYIQREFKMDIRKFFLNGGCPHSMSEFNLLGAFAWVFFKNKFKFVDTEKEPTPDPMVHQFWSHGGAGNKENAAAMLKLGLTLT